MKRQVFFALLIFTAAFLFLSGCQKKDDRFKVAFISRTQGDSFAAWLANSVKEEAAKYPAINLTVFDGQAQDDRENSLIENAIVNKFDAIVIQPNNGESQRPYAEKVVAANIICITTNARISGIAGAYSVDADPYEQAAIQARAALDAVPQNAKVVVLLGPPGNFHADMRRQSWQQEFFAKRADVTIASEQIANWNKDEAMRIMEDAVQSNDKIDAVISMNDNMAAGAIEVVKGNPKYESLLVYGVDGTAEAALLIKEGLMTSTTLQNAYDLAVSILSTTDKLLKKEAVPVDFDINCPMVDSSNVDEIIEMYKKTGAL